MDYLGFKDGKAFLNIYETFPGIYSF